MLRKVLNFIRSKIDHYKLKRLIKQSAKETDKRLKKAYNRKFKYLGKNHIMGSVLISVTLESMLYYRNLFKKLSEFDLHNPKEKIDYTREIPLYVEHVNVNRFLTHHREDPIKVYRETIRYYKLFNYRFIRLENTEPNNDTISFLNSTRKLRMDFLTILNTLDKIEL